MKTANYTIKEKILLASLIRDMGEVIENKKTDSVSLEQKNSAWDRMAANYNSQPEITTVRSAQQLKKLWANIKQKKRSENTNNIYETLKTGGGKREDPEPDPLMEIVDVAAPNAEIQLSCKWDSTAVFIESQNATTSEAANNENSKEVVDNFCTPSTSSLTYTVGPVSNKSSSGKRKRDPLFAIDEEKNLRIKKIKESIQQQRQIHDIRLKAAKADLFTSLATSKIAANKITLDEVEAINKLIDQ